MSLRRQILELLTVPISLLLVVSALIAVGTIHPPMSRITPAAGAKVRKRAPGPMPAPTAAARQDIPPPMLRLYEQAATDCRGLPWPVLAAIGKLETDHGRQVHDSPTGAKGPMQFLPSTWAEYGVDGGGDGRAEIADTADAVHGAAHYLCANGAGRPQQLRGAIWTYNHAGWYVNHVLQLADRYGGPEGAAGGAV